jgi:hypothetical protein
MLPIFIMLETSSAGESNALAETLIPDVHAQAGASTERADFYDRSVRVIFHPASMLRSYSPRRSRWVRCWLPADTMGAQSRGRL